MPAPVTTNYSANFQRFVDFASKAAATERSGTDTAARMTGAPQGDYKGAFASFWRSNEMKTANDQVRDLFRKAVADMFGGENNIPDIVRDAMKLEDFGKGRPLTARRILAVKSAIDILGGGLFTASGIVAEAKAMGYLDSEMPKLARVANLYQQATGCTAAEAEAAALDPSSNARKLFDIGGRFTANAANFKRGLELMDQFKEYFGGLVKCNEENGARDTSTKINMVPYTVSAQKCVHGVQKFIFEELAANSAIDLNAPDPESIFGMKNNPAARFILRGFGLAQTMTVSQVPKEKRSLIYELNDIFNPLMTAEGVKKPKIIQFVAFTSRALKHYDELAALRAAGKLTRQAAFDILYPDIEAKGAKDARAINDFNDVIMAKVMAELGPEAVNSAIMVLSDTGATLDEVIAAFKENRKLPSAPYVSQISCDLGDFDGTGEAGINSMRGDIYRPAGISKADNNSAIECENKFVLHFGDETIKCGGLSEQESRSVLDKISDKLRALTTRAHPKQLNSLGFALGQGPLGELFALKNYGYNASEHTPVQYFISRNDETGDINIKIKEPEGCPIKFNWQVTVDVDGKTVATPMRVDYGQYEAEALSHIEGLAGKMPGNDRAAAEALAKDLLAYCGDDFDLKDIVSKYIYEVCVTAGGKLRTTDQIKEKIDAIRANLEEVRTAANGNPAAEKAGVIFMVELSGKSAPAGFIGNIAKAVARVDTGEYAKLSANSSPKQLVLAVVDLRKAVEKAMLDARVGEAFDGGPERTAARGYVAALIQAKIPTAQLKNIVAAFRSETATKTRTLLDNIADKDYPVDKKTLTLDQRSAIDSQCMALNFLSKQYNLSAETILGIDGGEYVEFEGAIDKKALGHAEIFDLVLKLANEQLVEDAERARREENIKAGMKAAKANAQEAYAKAGAGNGDKVNLLINAAIQRCSANADAVKVVADNIDNVLVGGDAKLRTINGVRERASAIAANFDELTALSKDKPGVYEAGKQLMTAMGGKPLPAGLIGKLALAADKAGIDALGKLSRSSSGHDIHRAVTQFRNALAKAMEESGANEAAESAHEKQACRNFVAALLLDRCGESALRAMRQIFAGDTPAKMLALYENMSRGAYNEGLPRETAVRLEDQASSHMMHLAALKDALDLAPDGQPGAGLAPFEGDFHGDSIGGPAIFDDLVNQAER